MSNLDKIFQAYDIRGIYPEEINEEVAYKIGRAVAKFLKTKEIIIGRDSRISSDNLFKVLSEGVRDEGVGVIDIGLTTTPMLYFSIVKWGIKGGVMITASHNPPQYNGFKIVRDEAMPVGEDSGLKKIKKLVERNKFNDKNRGGLKNKGILNEYVKNILRFTTPEVIRPLKIIADTANGTAGIIIPKLFRQSFLQSPKSNLFDKRIPANLIHIFAPLDGSFPGHNPDPTNPENTKALQEKVLSEGADLGVAFDGDGDRILFIDEKGRRINPNFIFTLLINNFFQNKGKILYDVIASRIVKEEIEKTGNIPVCSKVGHTFVKEKMKKDNIVFGAESSGHYYLKDNYFIESPFIVLLKVLEILSQSHQSLSELIRPFQKYYLERINLRIKNTEFQRINIVKQIKKKYKKTVKISRFDGLTFEFPDWWFNLRSSHTEPVLRLTIEAKTKKLLKEKKQEILSFVS